MLGNLFSLLIKWNVKSHTTILPTFLVRYCKGIKPHNYRPCTRIMFLQKVFHFDFSIYL